MKSYRVIFLAILLLPFYTSLRAQSKQSLISAEVFNPENQPAEYSTAVLMNQDSVFIKGTLTGSDGVFLFDRLGAGTYHVMLRNVEYNTWISGPIVLSGTNRVELDGIRLEAKINDLEEVVIKGERAMVEVHPDKMVFNVSASANSTGNNALELLEKSPGVVVDMDKNIVLQGKSGVQVYINGRPSRISGADLSNMLESMRSDEIESIELITNPSSKFDAEGTAGIINIILKKSLDAGFNGSLRSNYSKGFEPRIGAGTSLNYSNGKVNLFSSLNLTDDTYYQTNTRNNQRELYRVDQADENQNFRQGLNFMGGMDYQINNEHSVSVDARVLLNERSRESESITIIEDLSGVLDTENLLANNTGNGSSNNFNTNLNYSFKPNRATSFSADVSAGTFSNSNYTYQPNLYYNSDQSTLLSSVLSEFNTGTNINIFSAKVDFERKMDNLTLSAGSKYSYINTDNSLAFYNILNDVSELDDNRSNDFSYLEKVAAVYGILTAKLSERINLNAGLRVENTSSLGELISANPGPDDVVPRNYTSLFPNVGVSYNDQENHALSLSFGRRITRPNYRNLNPFEEKTSELSAWKGNPFLKPNYIQNYQVSYSFRRKLVISNTFSITDNYFANVFVTTGDKSNVLGPQNMDKVTNNGLSVSYPLKVTKWWEFTSFFIYNNVQYGDIEGIEIGVSRNVFNFRMQNNIRLPLGVRMEVSAFLSSPFIWGGTVYVDEYYRLNLGLKKDFFDGRLLLQASANDILDTGSNYYYNSNYGGMIVDGVIGFDGRRFALSATYNFGNQKLKTRRSKSALDEELRRLSD